ncbi:hypothetical protein ACJRO7_001415 [Eucalyptus globulus]|uniref:Secreted protein n=1 Tax=Eucalyptus globulus TaxID=34317 RepID=A0ABD3LW43_EUCGL
MLPPPTTLLLLASMSAKPPPTAASFSLTLLPSLTASVSRLQLSLNGARKGIELLADKSLMQREFRSLPRRALFYPRLRIQWLLGMGGRSKALSSVPSSEAVVEGVRS